MKVKTIILNTNRDDFNWTVFDLPGDREESTLQPKPLCGMYCVPQDADEIEAIRDLAFATINQWEDQISFLKENIKKMQKLIDNPMLSKY